MRRALLVSCEPAFAVDLARRWTAAGDAVTLVLLDAAAATARASHPAARALGDAVRAGAAVAAHDDALRRRAIGAPELAPGVKAITLDEVADLLTDGVDRAVWL